MRSSRSCTGGLGSTSSAAIVALAAAQILGGCDNPDPPMQDAGPAPIDAGFDGGFDAGAPPPDAGRACEGPPGLYGDSECQIIAVGVRPYAPRFALWADDAEKERYVYLPTGTTINTTDPDNWVFPVGTVLYKTFLLGGVRLETRVFEKTGNGNGFTAWETHVYAWNEAQDAVEDVTTAPLDRRSNVLGTEHDIPSGSDCVQCHSGTLDVINGFSAIMLNHDNAGVNLGTLLSENLLDPPLMRTDATVPGDEATQNALGYLHANCGHCHHAPLPTTAPNCHTPACNSGLHMWLATGTATLEDSTVYQTAVNVMGMPFGDTVCRITPGDAAASSLIYRMSSRTGGIQMPPLATEMVHTAGVAAITGFINGLTVTADPTCTR